MLSVVRKFHSSAFRLGCADFLSNDYFALNEEDTNQLSKVKELHTRFINDKKIPERYEFRGRRQFTRAMCQLNSELYQLLANAKCDNFYDIPEMYRQSLLETMQWHYEHRVEDRKWNLNNQKEKVEQLNQEIKYTLEQIKKLTAQLNNEENKYKKLSELYGVNTSNEEQPYTPQFPETLFDIGTEEKDRVFWLSDQFTNDIVEIEKD